jgi:YbbR domain-containing protein
MCSLDSKKIVAKVVRNWPAKVLSIILAVFLFVFHRMSTMEERFFSVPLNVQTKGNLTPSSSYPRMIRVRLRGDPNSIYPILEDDIEAFADFEKYDAPGTYHSPVEIRKKGTALGIEPLEIAVDPLSIGLSLDHRISKFVPLTPSIRGRPDSGYSLSSYTLNPTQVIIDGPSELIAAISEFHTDFIDLDGRTGDFSMMVNILNRDPLIVIRGNGITEFRGFISRIIPVRNIADIPIRLEGLDERFVGQSEIRAASVHFEGRSQDELDQFILPLDFLYVDCSGISEPGTYTLPVLSAPVPGLTMTIDPAEVVVHVLRNDVLSEADETP